jgi:hypothetical protein
MGNPCVRGFHCSARVGAATTNVTCIPLPTTGQKCWGHCEAPAHCIGDVCRAGLGERGERCQPRTDGCRADLICDLTTTSCSPRRPRGAACNIHGECASGACVTSPRTGLTTCR